MKCKRVGCADEEYQIAGFCSSFCVVADERDRLKSALRLILPMAKGYAHEHQVGRNDAMVIEAEDALGDGAL